MSCNRLGAMVLWCNHLVLKIMWCNHLGAMVLWCNHLVARIIWCYHLVAMVILCNHLVAMVIWSYHLVAMVIWCNHLVAMITLVHTLFTSGINSLRPSDAKFINFHSRKCIWKCRLRKGVYSVSAQWVKTGSAGVSSHVARGRVRHSKSNPEAVRPMDFTCCSHKPECIVSSCPDKSILITTITWQFQFHLVNVSIRHLRYEYRARSESRFACCSHCYITWCPLTTGSVVSQCPSSKDVSPVNVASHPLISASSNPLKRIPPQWNIFTMNLQTYLKVAMLILTPMITGISHKRW